MPLPWSPTLPAPFDDPTVVPTPVQSYADLLSRLFPRGAVWVRALQDGELAQWVQGLAPAFARVHSRAWSSLLDEAFPDTCSETIADWERNAGLPDPLLPLPATFAARRGALLAHETAHGGQSRAYLIAVAAAAGVVVTIAEQRPCVAGLAVAGDPCNDAAWAYAMIVHAPPLPPGVPAVAGGAHAGDPILDVRQRTVEAVLRRVAPAHIAIVFVYDLI